MPRPTDLTDAEMDDVAAGTSAKPEYRYVPVRRTQSSAAASGLYALPEIEDEVLVMFAKGQDEA
ncbi:MAG: hypothetical protein AAGD13_12315 [Pseudomonadota bacterium]